MPSRSIAMMASMRMCGEGHHSPSPDALQLDLDCVERFGANLFVAGVGRQEYPMASLEAVYFEGLEVGIEEPKVRHAETSVERELAGAVESASGWRQDLRLSKRVGHCGSRADDQLSIHDLAHEMLRQREDVLVAGSAPRGLRHCDKIARPRRFSGTGHTPAPTVRGPHAARPS